MPIHEKFAPAIGAIATVRQMLEKMRMEVERLKPGVNGEVLHLGLSQTVRPISIAATKVQEAGMWLEAAMRDLGVKYAEQESVLDAVLGVTEKSSDERVTADIGEVPKGTGRTPNVRKAKK